MAGDIEWFTPGSHVPATLVADGTGAVPERGEGLALAGENEDMAEVSAIADPANFVGTLVEVPPDFDEAATYAAGDVVGEVTVLVRHYIDWLVDGSGGTLAAGDQVVHGADGVRAFDPVDAGADDQSEDIVGTVWYSGSDGTGTSDKVAVVRQRR